MPKKRPASDDIGDQLAFIIEKIEHLPTRVEVRAVIHDEVPPLVALELRPVLAELREINRRLDKLEHDVRDMRGYAKEIDMLRKELNAIKKHLGIDNQIAA